MKSFGNVTHATIITKRVSDCKKLEIIAQEYTYRFAAISISICSYNQNRIERICDRSNDYDTHMTTEV